MARKRTVDTIPYGHNEHIVIYYEHPFGNDLIKPGDVIKVKNVRSSFKVDKFVHHMQHGRQWVDCMDTKTGEFRSFYLEKIKLVVRPKKSRRKKLVAGT